MDRASTFIKNGSGEFLSGRDAVGCGGFGLGLAEGLADEHHAQDDEHAGGDGVASVAQALPVRAAQVQALGYGLGKAL